MTRSQIGPTVLILLLVAVGVFAHGLPQAEAASSHDESAGPPRPPAAVPRERFPDEAWRVRDLYARLMRYERAARQLAHNAPGAAVAPEAYLTVTLRRIRTREVAVERDPRPLDAPAGPVLSIARRTYCHRDDPCHVAYAVEWADAAATGSETVPVGPVTRVTSYDVTLALGNETRDYSAEVRYHAGDGGALMPEVVDPVLPGLQQIVNDRAPLAVAPWLDYVRTRRYAAVVRRLKERERGGRRVVPGRTPMGFLPGDEVTTAAEQQISMLSGGCGPIVLEVRADNASLRPDGTGSPSATTLYVFTDPPTSGLPISLTVEGERNSGGHIDDQHAGPRPAGTLYQASGTTDANGAFRSGYVASVIGERVTITARGAQTHATLTLDVKVSGLVELGPGAHYTLIGFDQTPWHPQGTNHWGTSYANGQLVAIANAYQAAFLGAGPLLYNDQSLPWGGKFDLAHGWSDGGSHGEHRLGTNGDVDSTAVPTTRWAALVAIFANNGSPNYGDETADNHWHLRF